MAVMGGTEARGGEAATAKMGLATRVGGTEDVGE